MAWTVGRAWATNELATAAKMNEISGDLNVLGNAWTSYTPTWISTGTAISAGNAAITGSQRTVGKTVDFRILIIMGSSTTYGTGFYNISLPSTPNLTSWEPLGMAGLTDTSLSDRYGFVAIYAGGSNVTAVSSTATRLAQTVPFTWASTDRLAITGRYEIA